MNGKERRKELLSRITNTEKPVSGTLLAAECQVSRQVIVQDIAILRAEGHEILATNRGYLCVGAQKCQRIYRVNHREDQIREELYTIVDCGGCVQDVFVNHEIYGEIRAELNLSSRRQIQGFLEDIMNGKSAPLMNITSGLHAHTVVAESEQVLDQIEEELQRRGILIVE